MPSEVLSNSELFQQLSRSLLQQGIAVRFRAQGSSMVPQIYDGDLVEVEPVLREQIKVGDVVLFDSEKGIRAHRVVSITKCGVITCGDSSLANDEAVAFDKVIGRISWVDREVLNTPVKSWLRSHATYRRLRTFYSTSLVQMLLWMKNSIRNRT